MSRRKVVLCVDTCSNKRQVVCDLLGDRALLLCQRLQSDVHFAPCNLEGQSQKQTTNWMYAKLACTLQRFSPSFHSKASAQRRACLTRMQASSPRRHATPFLSPGCPRSPVSPPPAGRWSRDLLSIHSHHRFLLPELSCGPTARRAASQISRSLAGKSARDVPPGHPTRARCEHSIVLETFANRRQRHPLASAVSCASLPSSPLFFAVRTWASQDDHCGLTLVSTPLSAERLPH